MRKEASLEQWHELYDVTQRIQSLQPWEHLWDMDLITLQLPEYEQPFFASVMGRNGECFAIAVMEGIEALNQLGPGLPDYPRQPGFSPPCLPGRKDHVRRGHHVRTSEIIGYFSKKRRLSGKSPERYSG